VLLQTIYSRAQPDQLRMDIALEPILLPNPMVYVWVETVLALFLLLGVWVLTAVVWMETVLALTLMLHVRTQQVHLRVETVLAQNLTICEWVHVSTWLHLAATPRFSTLTSVGLLLMVLRQTGSHRSLFRGRTQRRRRCPSRGSWTEAPMQMTDSFCCSSDAWDGNAGRKGRPSWRPAVRRIPMRTGESRKP